MACYWTVQNVIISAWNALPGVMADANMIVVMKRFLSGACRCKEWREMDADESSLSWYPVWYRHCGSCGVLCSNCCQFMRRSATKGRWMRTLEMWRGSWNSGIKENISNASQIRWYLWRSADYFHNYFLSCLTSSITQSQQCFPFLSTALTNFPQLVQTGQQWLTSSTHHLVLFHRWKIWCQKEKAKLQFK